MTEDEDEIEYHRSRLIENLPHLSLDVLRSTFSDLLKHDSAVRLISKIMPSEMEHCLLCHEDYDKNAKKNGDCIIEHELGEDCESGGCPECRRWDCECFFCKYCGGLEFCEEDDGYHEAPCLEGHVSSMSNISAAYEEYFRDQGCEVPACKEKLQKWRQDIQNEAEVKERRRLEQKERDVVMAAEQKSLQDEQRRIKEAAADAKAKAKIKMAQDAKEGKAAKILAEKLSLKEAASFKLNVSAKAAKKMIDREKADKLIMSLAEHVAKLEKYI